MLPETTEVGISIGCAIFEFASIIPPREYEVGNPTGLITSDRVTSSAYCPADALMCTLAVDGVCPTRISLIRRSRAFPAKVKSPIDPNESEELESIDNFTGN